jgi:hypothetical protein
VAEELLWMMQLAPPREAGWEILGTGSTLTGGGRGREEGGLQKELQLFE